MSVFVVDVEADGPCPGLYSMVEVGVVKINRDESFETFYGSLHPLETAEFVKEALDAIGIERHQTEEYDSPHKTMRRLSQWVKENNSSGRPMFYSDNNGFDWQFVNYYFHLFLGENPFGHSSTNIGSLWKGMEHDMWKTFKHLRKTKHDHNPVNDAKGNAEALIAMKKKGLKISFG